MDNEKELDFSAGDVEAWLGDAITSYFFKVVRSELKGCDDATHDALSDDEPNFQQAMIQNAGKEQLEAVLRIPEDIKDLCKEQ